MAKRKASPTVTVSARISPEERAVLDRIIQQKLGEVSYPAALRALIQRMGQTAPPNPDERQTALNLRG